MKIDSFFFSLVGQKSENEDAVLSRGTADGWWAAIADGMGGRAGGKIASSTAIAEVEASISKSPPPSIPTIFASVKRQLELEAQKNAELSRMGTTLSLVAIKENNANVGHVGDSRIYHLRNEGIVGRTIDQTEAQELIARGVLSKADARRYSRRNILLSVMSPTSDYQLLEEHFEVLKGDRLILVTDGISSKMFAREIRDLSLESKTAQVFCEKLAQEVGSRDPTDDYSAICIDVL